MKILEKDLEQSLLNKINRLDSIVANYGPNNADGVVAYNASGFYIKKLNDSSLRKIYNEDEIMSLHESLLDEKALTTSTNFHVMNHEKYDNKAIRSFLKEASLSTVATDLKENVYRFKNNEKDIVLLYSNGRLKYISENQLMIDYQISDLLLRNHNIDFRDIVDLDVYDGQIYLATYRNGIIKFNGKEVEVVCTELYLQKIAVVNQDLVFCVTDEYCSLFNMKVCKRAEKMNILNKLQQNAKDIFANEFGIAILGDPVGVPSDSVVHCLLRNKDDISFNLIDYRLPKNPASIYYSPKFIRFMGNKIYVSGQYKENVFIWTINPESREFTEKIIDCIKLDDLRGFEIIRDNFIIATKSNIYVTNDNTLEEKYFTDCEIKRMYSSGSNLYIVDSRGVAMFVLQENIAKNETLVFDIFRSYEPCNNIDILVKNASRNEPVKIFDKDTMAEIKPAYYAIYNGSAILKLINCKSTALELRLTVTATSDIGGIVVKTNRQFMR